MKFHLSSRAFADYQALPPQQKKIFEKQIGFLVQDIRYPSLRAKKYEGRKDQWQARVDYEYRFYFEIVEDVYNIVAIIKHPK